MWYILSLFRLSYITYKARYISKFCAFFFGKYFGIKRPHTQLKRYYINPKFLNLESDLNVKKLEQELNKKYPFDENDKNIVPILEKSIIIKDNKYNENQCKIYMTPEEKELSKEKKEENKTKKKVIVAKTPSNSSTPLCFKQRSISQKLSFITSAGY